jgi:hypothetical protein
MGWTGDPYVHQQRNPWSKGCSTPLGGKTSIRFDPASNGFRRNACSRAWVALIGVLAMLAHLTRLWLWHPWKTLNTPLVWVLHAAYAWIPIALGVSRYGCDGVGFTFGCHACMTAGAIGDNGHRHDDTHSARPHGEKAGCWKNGSGLLLTSVRGSSDSCLRSIIESVTFDLRGSNLCCDVVIWVCPVYRSVLGHSRLRIKLKSLASHDRR